MGDWYCRWCKSVFAEPKVIVGTNSDQEGNDRGGTVHVQVCPLCDGLSIGKIINGKWISKDYLNQKGAKEND